MWLISFGLCSTTTMTVIGFPSSRSHYLQQRPATSRSMPVGFGLLRGIRLAQVLVVTENNCTTYISCTSRHIHSYTHQSACSGCFWKKPRNRKLNQEALALLALTCGLGFCDFVNLFNYSLAFPYLDNWIIG